MEKPAKKQVKLTTSPPKATQQLEKEVTAAENIGGAKRVKFN